MSIKIAINGFGRIGRGTLREIFEKHPNLEVLAINDLTDIKTLAHLLKYDSVYGKFSQRVEFGDNWISVGAKKINIFSEKDPENLPWKKMGIDIVLECTGIFTDGSGTAKNNMVPPFSTQFKADIAAEVAPVQTIT